MPVESPIQNAVNPANSARAEHALGCGDFAVGRELTQRIKNVKYLGCDIVPELIAYNNQAFSTNSIAFKVLDIVSDELPQADVCLVRQVLQHLPNKDIEALVAKLAKYKAVFITEGYPMIEEGPINPDLPLGGGVQFNLHTGRGRGVELDKPPYNKRIEELCRIRSSLIEVIVTFRARC